MNLPNRLTLFRFVLAGILVVVMLIQPGDFWPTLSFIIFAIAALTDFLDGWLARRLNMKTDFGALMDPLADKVLVCAVFILFVEMGKVASWMAILIVTRELAVTGLRVLAASQQVTLAADTGGKIKTILQMAAITLIFIELIASQKNIHPDWLGLMTGILLYLCVILTAISAISYFWRNRSLYLDHS